MLHLKKNEPLKNHCSYKTGGNALYFAEPVNTYELIEIIEFASNENLETFIFGKGSNILFSDNDFNAVVISTARLNNYILRKENNFVVGAGIKLDNFVKFSIFSGFEGAENLSGIPGCIGGNVFMNAGAFDTEMKDIVLSVTVLNEDDEMEILQNEEIGFDYRRTLNLNNKIILSANMILRKSNNSDAFLRRIEILKKRSAKQPLDFPSCGSVFKRPENNYAGTLIESCGLKGFSLGGAKVSEKHANFILNFNNATSSDIYSLINHVKETVFMQTGILLEEEVKLINFD